MAIASARLAYRTAREEAAARRQVNGTRDLARDPRFALRLHRCRMRHRIKQRAGIGVARVLEDRGARAVVNAGVDQRPAPDPRGRQGRDPGQKAQVEQAPRAAVGPRQPLPNGRWRAAVRVARQAMAVTAAAAVAVVSLAAAPAAQAMVVKTILVISAILALANRTASASRPLSVSSRIANLGCSIASCRISARFISPPENPSFT